METSLSEKKKKKKRRSGVWKGRWIAVFYQRGIAREKGAEETNEVPSNGFVNVEENEEVLLVEGNQAEIELKGEGEVAEIGLAGLCENVGELRVDWDVGEHLDVRSEGDADVLN